MASSATSLSTRTDVFLRPVSEETTSIPPRDHAVARFNANGSLDTTFGAGGRVKFDVRSTDDRAREMLVQSDGKIVLVGSSQRPGLAGGFDTVVSRLNTDGSLDPSFGAAGKVVIALSNSSSAGAVAVGTEGPAASSLPGKPVDPVQPPTPTSSSSVSRQPAHWTGRSAPEAP
jgi:uncharacterized delta-60 repeat protein